MKELVHLKKLNNVLLHLAQRSFGCVGLCLNDLSNEVLGVFSIEYFKADQCRKQNKHLYGTKQFIGKKNYAINNRWFFNNAI